MPEPAARPRLANASSAGFASSPRFSVPIIDLWQNRALACLACDTGCRGHSTLTFAVRVFNYAVPVNSYLLLERS